MSYRNFAASIACGLALFGSVSREDFWPESDVNVLVDFEPDVRMGLVDFAGMEIQLSELPGRKVDLNTPEFLSPYFVEEVPREAESIYGAFGYELSSAAGAIS